MCVRLYLCVSFTLISLMCEHNVISNNRFVFLYFQSFLDRCRIKYQLTTVVEKLLSPQQFMYSDDCSMATTKKLLHSTIL